MKNYSKIKIDQLIFLFLAWVALLSVNWTLTLDLYHVWQYVANTLSLAAIIVLIVLLTKKILKENEIESKDKWKIIIGIFSPLVIYKINKAKQENK